MDSKAFGTHLKSHRLKLKLDQETVAHNCNISPYTYKEYENGSRLPRLHTFVDLCKALQISPNYLLAADLHPDVQAAESTYVEAFSKIFHLNNKELMMVSDYIDMLLENRKKYKISKWEDTV